MNRMTSRSGLLAVMLAHSLAAISAIPAGFLQAFQQPRKTQPNGGRRPRLTKQRPSLYCKAAHRRAVKYLAAAPKIDGVRMRWEKGMLVPRTCGQMP